jgi:hypothetical protein
LPAAVFSVTVTEAPLAMSPFASAFNAVPDVTSGSVSRSFPDVSSTAPEKPLARSGLLASSRMLKVSTFPAAIISTCTPAKTSEPTA